MKKNNFMWGALLILLGMLLLANRFFSFRLLSMSTLWPLFILVPGLLFESGFFIYRKDPGLLVPGGILTTIGLLFLFETFTGWKYSAYTWPVYPLSAAIGLFQLYLFTGRNGALLIPVAILGGVSVIAFFTMTLNAVLGVLPPWFNMGLIVPVFLIVIGVYVMSRRR
jgi:hypothetical protein